MSTSIPLQSVGRALARLGALHGPRPAAGEAGGETRAAILAHLEAADDVQRVEEIATVVGMHPNTVRGHLDALLAAGRITRISDQRATRGRPHWLYSATATASVRELARALDEELDSAHAPDAARLAAATWVDSAAVVDVADTVDEAVDTATEALTDFGFDAVRNPVGDEITLRACPYAELIDEHPVICDIHAELLREVLARTGQPVTLARLDVLPRPGLCVAHLDRADMTPVRTVELSQSAPGPQAAAAVPGARSEAPKAPRTTPRTTPSQRRK
ncbi:MAG: hypothetical protein WCF36_15405 [Candidatus Nanopelagicales bacterium]